MKRYVSILLCILILAGTIPFCANAADSWIDAGIDYTESLDTYDTNPGRGWSPYPWIVCNANGTTQTQTSFSTGISTPMYDLSAFSAGNDRVQSGSPSVSVDNPNRVGGVDMDINQQTLDAMETTFAAAEAQGIQLIPRFAYAWDDYVGCEPSELKWILRHIEQISAVINKHKDTIISIECGMIGPWGEMHSSNYADKQNANQIIGAWLNHLDKSITVQVRNAGYIINYLNTIDIKLINQLPLTEESPAYRLGLYNDGYLGTGQDYGTWATGTSGNNFTRSQGITFMKEQNQRIPYGGEMAYADLAHIKGVDENGNKIGDPSPIYEDTFVQELYYTHLSYLRNIKNGPLVADELSKIILGKNHEFNGMPDVSAYYGQSLQKFMLDHMGYRFVLRSAETTGQADKGDIVQLRGTIENVGFGNLLAGMTVELILIDGNDNATIIDSHIDPQSWKTAERTDYNIMLSVPRDAASGEYRVYLRFGTLGYEKATNSRFTIHFANNDIWNADYGANYIGSFTVTDHIAGYADTFAEINTNVFEDIPVNKWYYDAVYYALGNGLMNGMSQTVFSPDTTTTRAMLVKVLYELEGQPNTTGTSNPFTDVPENRYFTAPVKWAYSTGIVKGMTESTYCPETPITREQFATILYRYAQYKNYDVSASANLAAFPDADKTSSFAKTALSWANAEQLITGTKAGNQTLLDPQGNATRAQMATILMRFIRSTAGNA